MRVAKRAPRERLAKQLNIPEAMVDRHWLNANEQGWWLGNKIAFINQEIISFRSTTVLSAGQVRLNGIIRRRFGDVMQDHGAGSEIFMMRRRAVHGSTLPTLAADDEIAFKVRGGTRWGFFPEAEVAAQRMIVRNLTARPLGPANLFINNSPVPPFTFAPGGNVVIKWFGRHANSHSLWRSFDDAYRPASLDHRVHFYNTAGDLVWFSKVRDARRIEEEDGKFKLTIDNAFLVSIFGAEPSRFIIRVFSKARGLVSIERLQARIVRTGSTALSWATGMLCWQPSGLVRLSGCTNPEPLLQSNFNQVSTHFGITLPWPTIAGLDARLARKRSAANFAAIAASAGVSLENVISGPGRVAPGLQCDAIFEKLNAIW